MSEKLSVLNGHKFEHLQVLSEFRGNFQVEQGVAYVFPPLGLNSTKLSQELHTPPKL